MSFLFPLGLLVALAVAGPLFAHLLRRRRPQERVFPPARLVPPAPPVARRRAHIEDRALLGVRVLAVAALALLAAAPLIRCSRLALDRRSGASIAIAIVVDDSMSMQALLPPAARRGGATTRFELAVVAAREISSSLRAGDTATIVLAGAPARVALAPTSDAGAVRATMEQISRDGPSDRGTDLDGAIAIASSALSDLPHPDRRVVLLSDLADGNPSSPPLSVLTDDRLEISAPLEALRGVPPGGADDCAIIAATPEEPQGPGSGGVGGPGSVRVRLACVLTGARAVAPAIGVEILGMAGMGGADPAHARIGAAAIPPTPPRSPATFDVVVPLELAGAAGKMRPPDAVDGRPTLLARLYATQSAPQGAAAKAGAGGSVDAIASDDVAPVLGAATVPAVAVVVGEGGALDEVVATGGPTIVERALSALESGVGVAPIPSTPERDVDLAPFAGLIIDDPPGLGPESRSALGKWVQQGGNLLLGVGPRASSPPLGASLEPFVVRPARWEKVPPPPGLGVDPKRAGVLGDGVSPPLDLAPHGRAIFDREDVERMSVVSAWSDGGPLVATRAYGRGEAWVVALPFAPDISDLPLRPAFLALLQSFVARVRDRGAGTRLEIGRAWTAGADDSLEVTPIDAAAKKVSGRAAPLRAERSSGIQRVTPRMLGAYLVTTTPKGGGAADARRELRAVSPVPRETDLTPRALAPSVAAGAKSGLERVSAELSPAIAWGLVSLALIELAMRVSRLLRGARAEGVE